MQKYQLFDYFIAKLREKCVGFLDPRVSENVGHFWTRGGHF